MVRVSASAMRPFVTDTPFKCRTLETPPSPKRLGVFDHGAPEPDK